MPHNYETLLERAKSISGLTPELENCLKEIAPVIIPHLAQVTDAFYIRLLTAEVTATFLHKHSVPLDSLKRTHLAWLNSLFTQAIDVEFSKAMIKVGDAHVCIQMPLDFMAGAMTLIAKELQPVIVAEFAHDTEQCIRALQAVTCVTGLALVIMQHSYQLFD